MTLHDAVYQNGNPESNGPGDTTVTLAELNRRLDQAYHELTDIADELERRVALKRRRDARHRANRRNHNNGKAAA